MENIEEKTTHKSPAKKKEKHVYDSVQEFCEVYDIDCYEMPYAIKVLIKECGVQTASHYFQMRLSYLASCASPFVTSKACDNWIQKFSDKRDED